MQPPWWRRRWWGLGSGRRFGTQEKVWIYKGPGIPHVHCSDSFCNKYLYLHIGHWDFSLSKHEPQVMACLCDVTHVNNWQAWDQGQMAKTCYAWEQTTKIDLLFLLERSEKINETCQYQVLYNVLVMFLLMIPAGQCSAGNSLQLANDATCPVLKFVTLQLWTVVIPTTQQPLHVLRFLLFCWFCVTWFSRRTGDGSVWARVMWTSHCEVCWRF